MSSSSDDLREPWQSELDDYAAAYGLSRTEAMRHAVAALALARRQAAAGARQAERLRLRGRSLARREAALGMRS